MTFKYKYTLLLCLFGFCACGRMALTTKSWLALSTMSKERLWQTDFVNDSLGFAVGGETYTQATLLRTTDGGNHWETMETGIEKVIYDIKMISTDFGIATAYDAKLLLTYDGGQRWTLSQQYIPNQDWLPFKSIDFINDSLGLIVGGHAYKEGIIYRTTNGGQNWTFEWLDIELRDVQFTTVSTAFIVGYGLIRKSTDGGQSWQTLEARGDYFTALHFPSEEVGYVVGYQGSLLKTVDGGANWETLRSADQFGQTRHHYEDVLFIDEQNGYIVGHQLALVTEDGGESWQQIEGLDFERFNGLSLLGKEVIIVGDNGVMVKVERD